MTISTTTNRTSAAGNGVTTAFTVPFKFLSNADLVVLLVTDADGTSVTQVLTTNYTVTGAGDPTGTVTMLVAPPSGYTLIIYRDRATTQTLDLVDNDPLPAESVENAFDSIVMMVQRVKDLVARAFVLADSDTSGVSLIAPTPSASKFIRWNTSATAMENADIGTTSIGLPVAVNQGGTNAITAAAARTNLGVAPAAAGDIAIATAANTPAFLTIGTDGYVLRPSSTATNKMAWAGPDVHIINGYVDATVATSALTLTLKTASGGTPSATDPVFVSFHNSSASVAGYVTRKVIAATTLVVPSTATLGTTNSGIARLWHGLVDNAGTVQIAVINTLLSNGIAPVADDRFISGVAVSTAADNVGIYYTPTTATTVPFRVSGYIEISEATAGTWATAPTVQQAWTPGMKLPGDVVQQGWSELTTRTGYVTTIPIDNTIPQNTEGTQILAVSMTPTSAVNFLFTNTVVCAGADSGAGEFHTLALFQDSTAGALAAITAQTGAGTGSSISLTLNYRMRANTGASTTLKIRIGSASASGGVNSIGGTQIFGGAAISRMDVTEVMA